MLLKKDLCMVALIICLVLVVEVCQLVSAESWILLIAELLEGEQEMLVEPRTVVASLVAGVSLPAVASTAAPVPSTTATAPVLLLVPAASVSSALLLISLIVIVACFVITALVVTEVSVVSATSVVTFHTTTCTSSGRS
jgi:hypothetical protein